jgi:hypothetical protein
MHLGPVYWLVYWRHTSIRMLPNHFFPAKAVRAVKEARACPVPVRAVWALPATVRTELGTHDAKLPYFYEPYGLYWVARYL